jgi:hypothetical protein
MDWRFPAVFLSGLRVSPHGTDLQALIRVFGEREKNDDTPTTF